MSFNELPEPKSKISEKIIERTNELEEYVRKNYLENAKQHGAVRPRLRVAPTPELEEIVAKQLIRRELKFKGWSFKATRSGTPGFLICPIASLQNDMALELGFIEEE